MSATSRPVDPAPPAGAAAPLVLSCSPRPGGNSDTAARLFASALAAARPDAARPDAPRPDAAVQDTPGQDTPGQDVADRGVIGRNAACRDRSGPDAAGPDTPGPDTPGRDLWGPLFLRDFPVLPCVACDACAALAQRLAQGREPGAHAGPGALVRKNPLLPERGAPFLGCPLSLKDASAALLSSLALAPSVCLTAPVYFYHLPAMLKALLDRMQAFWAMRRAGVNLFAGERVCRVILVGARQRGDKLFEGSLLSLKYALAPAGLVLAEPLTFLGLEGPGDLAASAPARERIAAYAEAATGARTHA